MFRFGGKGNLAKTTGELERVRQQFPTADVNDAIKHLLKLVLRIGTLSGANEKLGDEVMRLRQAATCATVPEDYEELCDEILALQIGTGLSTLDGSEGELSLLHELIDGVLPIARALRGEGPGLALQRLRQDATEVDDDARRQLHRGLERITDGVGWLRQMCDVFKLSTFEVVGMLGQLSGDEAGAHRRLGKISERIELAGDVDELHTLRQALLHEAEGLVKEADQRVQRLSFVRDQMVRAQRQVNNLEAALQDANQMARTDPLTGLGNRRALEGAVEQLNKSDKVTGVIALDIDHFKRINDSHGHDVGDLVIRRVADVLRGELRGGDVAFRVGGEEFVALLSGTDDKQARSVAERIRLQFESQEVAAGEATVRATVSLGVTLWTRKQRFSEASRAADVALYAAKQAGRNRVSVG